MTSDIENLLADLRDPQQVDPPRPSRKRIAIFTGAIGILSVLLAGGALAFGVPTSLAVPPPTGDSRNIDLPESLTATPPDARSPATTAVAPSTPAVEAGSPRFDVATDINTIPIPADFPPSEVNNAKLWLTQQALVARCMDDQGFHFTYTPWWLRDVTAPPGPAEGEGPGTAFWLALWGEDDQPFGDDYDWTEAGCVGYAVHATGMDGMH